MKPLVVSFSGASDALAHRVASALGGTVLAHEREGAALRARMVTAFGEGTPIIGICAAGILIRLLAPVLRDKHDEPPVLAVSADGAHVVPLLGGHHGANRLARELADRLGAVAALTTASHTRFTRSLDEPPRGWVLENPEAAKPAMSALLTGGELALRGDAPWLTEAGYPISEHGSVQAVATVDNGVHGRALVYHPRVLVAGVGCERGTDASEVIGLVSDTLATGGLSPHSLAALASIDLKADETALLAAAKHFNVPLRLFTAAELAAERDRLPNPSALVESEVGTPGVAEAAAIKAGRLLVAKQKSRRATCAIGIAPTPIDVTGFGRAAGQLHLVGIGPGEAAQRTSAAVRALAECTDWVGYGLYLDLVADLRTDQVEHRYLLGAETERARHALELAGQGRSVALICSGDPQIYAMATLVMELLEPGAPAPISDAAQRVQVAVHPGISAVQAASAASGALLGHDFCCISLSDLLTPREVILNRLEGAALGDFVTALYNPRSGRRTELIEAAKAIFAAHRPPETPVVVAANLGRPEQRVEVTSLDAFDPAAVDMLTIVLIGSSSSRAFRRGDGRTVAFTPRGYARKFSSEAAE